MLGEAETGVVALVHVTSAFTTSDSTTVCLFDRSAACCFEHGLGDTGGAPVDFKVVHRLRQCVSVGSCHGEEEGKV